MKNVNQDYLLEIEDLKNNLTESKNKLEIEKQNVKDMEISFVNKEKDLEKSIEDLKKEVQKLKVSLIDKEKDYENINNELIKLREMSFTEDNEDNIENETMKLLSDEQVEMLNALGLTIIGGSLSWIKKMKEVLTNWNFISGENINNDFSVLKNAKLVLINTKMSHSLYYRAKSVIDRSDLNYDYINVSANIYLSLNTIYNVVKNNGLI